MEFRYALIGLWEASGTHSEHRVRADDLHAQDIEFQSTICVALFFRAELVLQLSQAVMNAPLHRLRGEIRRSPERHGANASGQTALPSLVLEHKQAEQQGDDHLTCSPLHQDKHI